MEIVYRLAPVEVAATNDASNGLQEDNNVEGNFDLGPFDADTDEVTYQPETTNNYKVTVFFVLEAMLESKLQILHALLN